MNSRSITEIKFLKNVFGGHLNPACQDTHQMSTILGVPLVAGTVCLPVLVHTEIHLMSLLHYDRPKMFKRGNNFVSHCAHLSAYNFIEIISK
jgi:hypothetical protein